MPELPEVEIVCRNLSEMLKKGDKIKNWIFFREDLRYKIPQMQLRKIISIPLVKIERRAKYILFNFGEYTVISHLGMTGAWRQENSNWVLKKHDHLAMELSKNRCLVYEDPRRFGFVEVIRSKNSISRFKELGVEPLDLKTNFQGLTEKFKLLKSPIKVAIMNQKLLVGVGNIYASEVLFRAGVNPGKLCPKVSDHQYQSIWREVVVVLNEAITCGGSTIENYHNSFGEMGNFQKIFSVYGRKDKRCFKCHTTIKTIVQAGRTTFWCPSCQKK